MSTHWTDKRAAVALVGGELARRGWKLYGWKEDKSDSMTDYYDPESWQGVATKDGVTLCVDVNEYTAKQSGRPDSRHIFADGPCTTCNGTGKRLRDYHEAAYSVTTLIGGQTERHPERFHKAGDPCQNCEGTGQRKESRPDPDAERWPTFHANPKGRVWHLETEGRIIASGVGVFTVADEKYDGHHQTTEEDRTTCTRCGTTGEEYDMRHDDCPMGRPKLRALVDRIEAAMPRTEKREPCAQCGQPVAYGQRCASCGRGNWECDPDGARMLSPAQADLSRAGFAVRAGKYDDSCEIVFPDKPDDATRAELKAAGFRWNRAAACWYGKRDRLPARYAAPEMERAS